MGQTARFERYAANLLYLLTKDKYEPGTIETFGKQVNEVYMNPFGTAESKLTAEEIKRRVVEKLTAGR